MFIWHFISDFSTTFLSAPDHIRFVEELNFAMTKSVYIQNLVLTKLLTFRSTDGDEADTGTSFRLSVQFLSFSCSFQLKFCQLIGWSTPSLGLAHPLWEILGPQLAEPLQYILRPLLVNLEKSN